MPEKGFLFVYPLWMIVTKESVVPIDHKSNLGKLVQKPQFYFINVGANQCLPIFTCFASVGIGISLWSG
jgi:hypothetical protein